jgi:hypothetical protein
VNTCLTTLNPGTTLSRAASPAPTARRRAGMYWASEAVLAAGFRCVVDGTRALGIHAPVNVDDLASAKQPPIRVPQPSQERSP